MTTTATDRTPERASDRAAGRTGSVFTGTGTLLRFALRRDRVRILVWLAALGLGSFWIAIALAEVYATDADRQAAMMTMQSPAGLAFTGPAHYFTDYNHGPILSHQMLGFTAILVGIMSVLFAVRHTRGEEEAGRAELVRAGPVGRHAHLASALILTAIINIALGAILALLLPLPGTETVTWPGSLLYGAGCAAVGLTFAGVAAVTAQLTQSSRGASGIGMAVVGAAYVIRASGDAAGSDLSWASPIGWIQQTFPYLENRWWPLGLNIGAFIALSAAGMALSARRDLGSGLRAPRHGRPGASAALRTPLGFTMRLHRGMLVGFGIGMAALGMSYGPFLGDIETQFKDIAIIDDALQAIGGATLVDSFLTMLMTITAVVAAIYGAMAVLRARSEETSGRSEPVLGTWQSRTTFLGSHVAVAALGSALVLVLAALFLGVTGQPTVEEPVIAKSVVAALIQVPALWVVVGIAALLVGWAPRAVPALWALIGYAGIVGYLGPVLQLPEWAGWLSPFTWVPDYPAEELTLLAPLLLTIVAAALVALGLLGFRRRDLNPA
ncbi:MAG: ABC transporter permease [Actinomycetia bacterium]|nr:ABC transporter permease [Actinomycetes bacterium]